MKKKNIFNFNSIFVKIFFIALFCMLIPMIISLIASTHFSTTYIEEGASSALINVAVEKINQLEMGLDNVSEQVEAITEQPFIRETFELTTVINNEMDSERLDKISENLEGYYQRSNGLIENIFLMQEDVVVADGIGGNSIGWRLDSEDFTSIEEAPGLVLRDPIESPTTGRPVMTIYGPIKNERGELEGIIGLALELNVLAERIVEGYSDTEFRTLILDDRGITLSSSEPEHVFELDFQEEELNKFYQQTRDGDTGIGSFTLDGIENIAAYAYSNKYNMYIVTYEPIENYMSNIEQIRSAIFIVIFLSVIIAAIIIYFFARKTTIPIISVAEQAEVLANGDLTVSIDEKYLKRKDEIGKLAKAFDGMTVNFREMIGKIINVSEQVAASSEELSASGEQAGEIAEQVSETIQDVSSGAEKQSIQVDKSFENLSVLIKEIEEVNEGADTINDMTGEMIESVDKGSKSVDESIEKINNVKVDTEEASEVIEKLGNTSDEIGQIVEMINNIAGQTNLLALNAAIEAARAGEAGRGFSVVADEIRDLAEESTNATGQISGLIENIRKGVSVAVEKMNDSIESVNSSVKTIEKNDDIFKEINIDADELKDIVNKVTKNVQFMTKNSHEFESNMKDIASVSQEFAGSSEEVAASSEEQLASTEEIVSSSKKLAEMADELAEVVNKFKV